MITLEIIGIIYPNFKNQLVLWNNRYIMVELILINEYILCTILLPFHYVFFIQWLVQCINFVNWGLLLCSTHWVFYPSRDRCLWPYFLLFSKNLVSWYKLWSYLIKYEIYVHITYTNWLTHQLLTIAYYFITGSTLIIWPYYF